MFNAELADSIDKNQDKLLIVQLHNCRRCEFKEFYILDSLIESLTSHCFGGAGNANNSSLQTLIVMLFLQLFSL